MVMSGDPVLITLMVGNAILAILNFEMLVGQYQRGEKFNKLNAIALVGCTVAVALMVVAVR
jgi:uncharacterized membrane protein YidH (DUF202 family)